MEEGELLEEGELSDTGDNGSSNKNGTRSQHQHKLINDQHQHYSISSSSSSSHHNSSSKKEKSPKIKSSQNKGTHLYTKKARKKFKQTKTLHIDRETSIVNVDQCYQCCTYCRFFKQKTQTRTAK